MTIPISVLTNVQRLHTCLCRYNLSNKLKQRWGHWFASIVNVQQQTSDYFLVSKLKKTDFFPSNLFGFLYQLMNWSHRHFPIPWRVLVWVTVCQKRIRNSLSFWRIFRFNFTHIIDRMVEKFIIKHTVKVYVSLNIKLKFLTYNYF